MGELVSLEEVRRESIVDRENRLIEVVASLSKHHDKRSIRARELIAEARLILSWLEKRGVVYKELAKIPKNIPIRPLK